MKLGTIVNSQNSFFNATRLKQLLSDLEEDSIKAVIMDFDSFEGSKYGKPDEKITQYKAIIDIDGTREDMPLNATNLKTLLAYLQEKYNNDDSELLKGLVVVLTIGKASKGQDTIILTVSRKQPTNQVKPTISTNNATVVTVTQTPLNALDNKDGLLVEIARLIEAIREHSYAVITNDTCKYATGINDSEDTVRLLPYDTYKKGNNKTLSDYKAKLENCLDCLNNGFLSF